MKIYWSIESIPELANLSPVDRQRVWRACSLRSFKHWQTWSGVLIAIGSVFLPIALLQILLWNSEDFLLGMLCSFVVGVLCSVVGLAIFYHIAITQARPYLREYIKQYHIQPRTGERFQ